MTRIFSEAGVLSFGRIYKTEVKPVHGEPARGGCMQAVNLGLGALYGDELTFRGPFHQAFFHRARKSGKARNLPEGRKNTIDKVFRDLEAQGILFDHQSFKPLKSAFRLRGGELVDSLEEVLLSQTANLPQITGGLDMFVRRFCLNTTRVWMFNPEGASTIGMEIDSDGDGLPDAVLPVTAAII